MATAAPPDLDAFPDAEAQATDDEAIRRIEVATGASSGEIGSFITINLMATTHDVKASKASNGDNYDITFKVDVEGFVRLSVEAARGKGSYSATWNKVHLGIGTEVRRLTASRDADGEMQFKFSLHLPQSEIARSFGRVGTKLGIRAELVLEPEQGTLGLADGTEVDLTSRADD